MLGNNPFFQYLAYLIAYLTILYSDNKLKYYYTFYILPFRLVVSVLSTQPLRQALIVFSAFLIEYYKKIEF